MKQAPAAPMGRNGSDARLKAAPTVSQEVTTVCRSILVNVYNTLLQDPLTHTFPSTYTRRCRPRWSLRQARSEAPNLQVSRMRQEYEEPWTLQQTRTRPQEVQRPEVLQRCRSIWEVQVSWSICRRMCHHRLLQAGC